MRKIQLFALLSLLIVSMTGCKYEEGPFISFVPKVERVTNSWIVSTATINGVQETNIDGFNFITFFKEGNASVQFDILGVASNYTGTWVFNEDKTTIILETDDDATGFFEWNRTFTIKKLKEKELQLTWTETTLSGDIDTYDVVFVPREV
jgi:hypothetical protein